MITSSVTSDVPLIPAAYLARLITLLETRGISVEDLLCSTGLTREALEHPNTRLSVATVMELITGGVLLSKDPAVGFELGLALKPTSHGWLGLAMMCCGSLREAIKLGEHYLTGRSPWRVHVFLEGSTAVIQYEEVLPLGSARILMLECLLGAVLRLGEFLLGHSLAHPAIEFCLDYPEPPHHARFQDLIPRLRYSCAKVQARLPAAWLERPLSFGEPVAMREARAALDNELRLVATDDWIERTRALLANPTQGYPDLEEAADKLLVSSRTLRRHLHKRGTTFQALREEARRARAITLLEQSVVAVDEVACELGYADAASFARAFQRWTGSQPASYRSKARPHAVEEAAHDMLAHRRQGALARSARPDSSKRGSSRSRSARHP